MRRVQPTDKDEVLLTDHRFTFDAFKNTWSYFEIPLTELGDPEFISGVVFQNVDGSHADFYLDDLAFLHK